jgi:predicted lactoylglutathione lyase
METKIFINLPVSDIGRSKDFFKSIGYSFDERFCDKSSACLVISDTIYVMLLTEDKMKEIMPQDVVDSVKSSKAVNSVTVESKEKVNEIAEKAKKAGAPLVRDPEDYGFMFHRSFNDPDGHAWNFIWMDNTQAKEEN